MVLYQALNNAGLKNPSTQAILDLGKGLNYGEMRKRVAQLSYLYQSEIGHGKRVAFLSQNTQAVVLSFFAFSNVGILSHFINPKEPNEVVVQTLKDLEITHIAVSADQLSRSNDLIRTYNLPISVIEIEKKKGGEYDTSYSPPPEHPLKETNQVLILRVNEFGEDPKYIFFNHKQIYTAATIIKKFYHLSSNDKCLTTMSWAYPFAFIHGMLFPLLNGATCAVDPQLPTEEEFIEYIAKNHINRFADCPHYFFELLAICKNAKYTLPGVKSMSVGMGILAPSLRKAFSMLKIPVIHCIGRAENFYTLAMEDTEKPCTPERLFCRTLPGLKYKVLNEAGDEIEGEEKKEGPLAIAGETVMNAYYHPDKKLAEKATKNRIRGTWLYTFDVARIEHMEEDAVYITILGKASDVIRTEKKYLLPDRMDIISKDMGDVIDAAGFVKFDKKNEIALACAIVKQGRNLTEEQICSYLKSRLLQEAPQSVHFVDSIPKDEFGNINRGALQRQFSGT